MKQLSSFLVINVSGGDRISYTYDEIDDETGDPISQNNKRSFFVIDNDLKDQIEAIRNYIRTHRLND